MVRPPLRILVLAALVLACIAPSAHAASSAQIHADAADGSIDGSYTLAELRAADRAVSVEQREYYGWDDAYRDHVASLTAPAPQDAPAPAEGGQAPGSASGARSAREQTKQPRAEAVARGDRADATPESTEGHRGSAPERETQSVDVVGAADIDTPAASTATSTSLWWLLAALPLLVLAVGAWRMWRGRRVRARQQAPYA